MKGNFIGSTTISGKFAPFIGLRDEDIAISTMITIYNKAVNDAATDVFGKNRHRKNHMSPELLSISMMRGDI